MRTNLVSRESAKRFLQSSLEDCEWLLRRIESEEGWLRFPDFLTDAIRNLKIENYSLLYSSEAAIGLMILFGFLSVEEVKELEEELLASSLDERSELLDDLSAEIGSYIENLVIPKTNEERMRLAREFAALSDEEQKQAIKWRSFYSAFLAGFFQGLSVMVHGEKLTSLVAQAKAGNDDAFVKAVQIDKRILSAVPYFRDRVATAHAEADRDFFDKLGYRVKCAPYRGKIRHKELWHVFATLDGFGLLDEFSGPELLRFCDEIGIGRHRNRIDDPKNLAKRLREYRKFQGRSGLATP